MGALRTKGDAMAVAAEETRRQDLRALRQDAVLTQGELAARLGVGPRIITKWENGEARPRPANIRKLAEVLGVSPREVLAALQRSTKQEG